MALFADVFSWCTPRRFRGLIYGEYLDLVTYLVEKAAAQEEALQRARSSDLSHLPPLEVD